MFSSILNSDDVYNNNKNIESLGVVAVDEDTVKFTLSSEDKSFLSNLTQPSAMPCNEEFFNETKGKYGLERTSLIYSGPFKISSWTHDSFIYITQNQGYVTTEVFPKSINFRIETDYEKRLENFQKDDSVAINVEFKDVDKLQSEKYSKTIFNDTVWTLAFNLKDEDMQSENLRKALINCFDRNAYKENMNEYHSFATTIIPPIMTVGDINYNEKYPDVFNYSYNPSQAKESYNEFLSEKEIERLKGATILVPDDNLHRYNISYIQQIWQKELGVFINLELLPSNDIEKKISKGDFKMAIIPIKADGNNIGSVLSRFLSDNQKNYFGFNSENFDKNLLNAQGVKDYNKVAEYYHTCENILKDSYFLVPMYFQSSIYINKSNVLGIDYSPYGNVIKFQKARLK